MACRSSLGFKKKINFPPLKKLLMSTLSTSSSPRSPMAMSPEPHENKGQHVDFTDETYVGDTMCELGPISAEPMPSVPRFDVEEGPMVILESVETRDDDGNITECARQFAVSKRVLTETHDVDGKEQLMGHVSHYIKNIIDVRLFVCFCLYIFFTSILHKYSLVMMVMKCKSSMSFVRMARRWR